MQQSLQPKLSHRHYASVSYALQNNTVFNNNNKLVEGDWLEDFSEHRGIKGDQFLIRAHFSASAAL